MPLSPCGRFAPAQARSQTFLREDGARVDLMTRSCPRRWAGRHCVCLSPACPAISLPVGLIRPGAGGSRLARAFVCSRRWLLGSRPDHRPFSSLPPSPGGGQAPPWRGRRLRCGRKRRRSQAGGAAARLPHWAGIHLPLSSPKHPDVKRHPHTSAIGTAHARNRPPHRPGQGRAIYWTLCTTCKCSLRNGPRFGAVRRDNETRSNRSGLNWGRSPRSCVAVGSLLNTRSACLPASRSWRGAQGARQSNDAAPVPRHLQPRK